MGGHRVITIDPPKIFAPTSPSTSLVAVVDGIDERDCEYESDDYAFAANAAAIVLR